MNDHYLQIQILYSIKEHICEQYRFSVNAKVRNPEEQHVCILCNGYLGKRRQLHFFKDGAMIVLTQYLPYPGKLLISSFLYTLNAVLI